MRILIDGDACPDKDLILEIAKEKQIEVILFMDYAHNPDSVDCQVVLCEVGNDSVDLALVKYASKEDIVITQDYGLASHVLSKGARVLHVSGRIIDDTNIEQLLMSRYISTKQRKAGKRMKGPAKRTKEDVSLFLEQLYKMIENKK